MIKVYKIVNGERRLMRFHARDWKRIKVMPMPKGTSWELAPSDAVNEPAPKAAPAAKKVETSTEKSEEKAPASEETQPKLSHKQFKSKGKAFMAKELGVDKDDYTATELADLMIEKQG